LSGRRSRYFEAEEDAVSDVLAATLNATVPNAGREVYSRSGETDIFIRADVLAEGTGPAKVFICETKWANGRTPIVEGLQEQIFRYVTAHTTVETLLVLCRQQKLHCGSTESAQLGFGGRRPRVPRQQSDRRLADVPVPRQRTHR
jgi:hypothetical protein